MTAEQELLTGIALTTFKVNGQVLALAEGLARPAGLTAAWWQVLGAVLRRPLTVAAIGREMGLTRQSVQRIADLLVEQGLAEYRPNPAHRRAKLIGATDAGLAAVGKIEPHHAAAARALVERLGVERAHAVVGALGDLSAALSAMADDTVASL